MLDNLARQTQIKLMGHVIADYPDREQVLGMIGAMVAVGVRVIEIQFPFSEPMADGPLFCRANQEAIERGVTVDSSFDLLGQLHQRYPQVSFIVMTYGNIVFKRGFERFVDQAVSNGAVGLIVPDFAADSVPELLAVCRQRGLLFIPVVSPNVSDDRMRELFADKPQLVYAAARTGVTGTRTAIGACVRDFLQRIRRHTDAAIACGFGISERSDVEALNQSADFAVVGSKSLATLEASGVSGVTALWQSLAQG